MSSEGRPFGSLPDVMGWTYAEAVDKLQASGLVDISVILTSPPNGVRHDDGLVGVLRTDKRRATGIDRVVLQKIKGERVEITVAREMTRNDALRKDARTERKQ